jgi:hypothetical protein
MERDSTESTRTRAAKFDFELFLRQLRSKKADPVLRYIRSFLKNFTKRPFTVEEQMKVINDFKEFIFSKMQEFEPFSLMDEVDFENAKAGVEKLVMSKIFGLTYSPVIKALDESHREDLVLDGILEENYNKFGNLAAKDLDVDTHLVEHGEQFIEMACQELQKMEIFKAPRAKIICILNSCKILFQLIKSSEQHQNADEFLPLLVYTTLRAKVPNLYSNLHYLERFSFINTSETQYYLVSLTAAAEYIRNLGKDE